MPALAAAIMENPALIGLREKQQSLTQHIKHVEDL